MGRSSPSAPGYLQNAIRWVENLLAERYPEPMAAREIADELSRRGYSWPLPGGYYHSRGRTLHRTSDDGAVTPDRVRRVCDMTGNRTSIRTANYGRPKTYTIWDFAIDDIQSRIALAPVQRTIRARARREETRRGQQ